MTSIATPITLSTSTSNSYLRTAAQIVGGALLLGVCAQIRIPLFFSPIPLSMQTLAVLLMGAFLGSRKGATSVALYMLWGILGAPVFAGGAASLAHLAGPSGGYIAGFAVQAYLAGWLFERRNSMSAQTLLAGLMAACAVQLGIGTLWLAQFVGWDHVFSMGFAPFIPGDILKSMIAAAAITHYERR